MFAGEAGMRAVPDAEWLPAEALGRAIDRLLATAAGGPPDDLDVRLGAEVTAILAACQDAIASGRAVAIGSSI